MKVRLNRQQRRMIKRKARRGKNLDSFDASWNDVQVMRAAKNILTRSGSMKPEVSVNLHIEDSLKKMFGTGDSDKPVPPEVRKMIREFPTDGIHYQDAAGTTIQFQFERLANIETVNELLADPVYQSVIEALENRPEFGIFSHPEGNEHPEKERSEQRSPTIQRTHECYSFDDRPIINGIAGVPDRRMYQSHAYLYAARKLRIGLEEKRPDKTVIWLSLQERDLVYDLVKARYHKKKKEAT